VTVVDASVLVMALAGDAPSRARAAAALRGRTLLAPDLALLEAVSALRRLVAEGALPRPTADAAVRDLREIPLTTVGHAPLLARCWALRSNLTPYDAAYVALAEALDLPLLTADARLARAARRHCGVEVLAV